MFIIIIIIIIIIITYSHTNKEFVVVVVYVVLVLLFRGVYLLQGPPSMIADSWANASSETQEQVIGIDTGQDILTSKIAAKFTKTEQKNPTLAISPTLPDPEAFEKPATDGSENSSGSSLLRERITVTHDVISLSNITYLLAATGWIFQCFCRTECALQGR